MKLREAGNKSDWVRIVACMLIQSWVRDDTRELDEAANIIERVGVQADLDHSVRKRRTCTIGSVLVYSRQG